jgi:hypothetical protein
VWYRISSGRVPFGKGLLDTRTVAVLGRGLGSCDRVSERESARFCVLAKHYGLAVAHHTSRGAGTTDDAVSWRDGVWCMLSTRRPPLD